MNRLSLEMRMADEDTVRAGDDGRSNVTGLRAAFLTAALGVCRI